MEYLIAIPSYDRAETLRDKTLAYLKSQRVPSSRILIFVHTDDQKLDYERTLPKNMFGKIIVAHLPKGISKIRNFITDYLADGQRYVSMDDDVTELLQLDNDSGGLVGPVQLQNLIKKGFRTCEKHGLTLWGVYPVANAFWMKNKKECTTGLTFIVGGFIGIINRKRHVTLDYKDDYERSLVAYQKDGGVVRFNHVCVKHAVYSKRGGVGLGQKERLPFSKADSKWLVKKFPGLVRLNPRREGEVLLRPQTRSKSCSQ